MRQYDNGIAEAASILSRSMKVSASCGAGLSAESGIQTFRDPGGLWDRLDPAAVGTPSGLINTLQSKPEKLIPLLFEALNSFEQAEPNPGHIALASMEKMGILKTVITQNVDNLHQEAGNTDVIEVHGNLFRFKCMSCKNIKVYERKVFIKEIKEKLNSIEEINLSSLISVAPTCEKCGYMTRPNVVMFGEAVHDLYRAYQIAKESDAMLVLGTSGVVFPAAYFPIEASKAGAYIIVINPTENPFTDITDVYIPMKTGEALPSIINRIKEYAV